MFFELPVLYENNNDQNRAVYPHRHFVASRNTTMLFPASTLGHLTLQRPIALWGWEQDSDGSQT
jgi:hypothetical protein